MILKSWSGFRKLLFLVLAACTAASAQVASSRLRFLAEPAVESGSLDSIEATHRRTNRVHARPVYNDPWHHRDGSTVIAFQIGGGFAFPAGATGHTVGRGWNLSAGIGWNANKYLGALAQFDWLQMPAVSSVAATQGAVFGNVHLWSVTLNPVVHYYAGPVFGAYVTGGAGFYRKVTVFQTPGQYAPCTGSICFVGNNDAVVASYYSNALGANGGAGFDWHLYPNAAAKVYMEARYTWVNNQPDASLAYRPASERTGAFPVTFGLRW